MVESCARRRESLFPPTGIIVGKVTILGSTAFKGNSSFPPVTNGSYVVDDVNRTKGEVIWRLDEVHIKQNKVDRTLTQLADESEANFLPIIFI